MAAQLFTHTGDRNRDLEAGNVVVGIDDDLKISVMGAMRSYLLRALSAPAAPSTDCEAKTPFYSAATDSSNAALSLPSGVKVKLLSSSERAALDATPSYPAVKKACAASTIVSNCGAGTVSDPWVSSALASDDADNRSIKDASAFCFCATLSPGNATPELSRLAKMTARSPVYVWFRFRERYIKDGFTKSCTAIRGLNDNAKMVNVLDYTIFWPTPSTGETLYKQQSGNYITSGLN